MDPKEFPMFAAPESMWAQSVFSTISGPLEICVASFAGAAVVPWRADSSTSNASWLIDSDS